jgi:aspartate racemase
VASRTLPAVLSAIAATSASAARRRAATYYRSINEEVRDRLGGHHCAQVVMVSLDFGVVRELQVRGAWDEAAALLVDGAVRLEAAGADVVVLCTNLMHKVAPAIEAATRVPLLHIADAVGARAQGLGVDQIGVLGTRQVMEESFYRDRLRERWGIDVIVPSDDDRAVVNRVIFDELTTGRIEPASKRAYLEIVDRLADRGVAWPRFCGWLIDLRQQDPVQIAEAAFHQVGVRLVKKSHWGHEDYGRVTTPCEQHPIRVAPKLEWIADVGWPLVATGKSICPGASLAY